jgi:hypothetical protein
MNRLKVLLIIAFVGLAGACSKSSSGPTSAEGKWSYTTPDSKMSVTFDLVKTSSGSLDIQNPTIKIEGVSYIAAAVMTGVALPLIGQIRINANDAKAVYPFDIKFNNGKVNSDFTKIDVPDGEYTYSGGSVSLKTIAIGRP